jgi:hypothetical protein
MQQYFVLCARARNADKLNTTTLLDFELEDGNFAYPLSDYLSDKVGRRTAARATSNGDTSPERLGRRNQSAEGLV